MKRDLVDETCLQSAVLVWLEQHYCSSNAGKEAVKNGIISGINEKLTLMTGILRTLRVLTCSNRSSNGWICALKAVTMLSATIVSNTQVRKRYQLSTFPRFWQYKGLTYSPAPSCDVSAIHSVGGIKLCRCLIGFREVSGLPFFSQKSRMGLSATNKQWIMSKAHDIEDDALLANSSFQKFSWLFVCSL